MAGKNITAERFVEVYLPACRAGKSAVEIAAELYGVAVADVTKTQKQNVTQFAGRLRREMIDEGADPARIPKLKRGGKGGRKVNKKWLTLLDELSPVETEETEGTAESTESAEVAAPAETPAE